MDVRLREGLFRWARVGAWVAFGGDLMVVAVFFLRGAVPPELVQVQLPISLLFTALWIVVHLGMALLLGGLFARLYDRDPAASLVAATLGVAGSLVVASSYIGHMLTLLRQQNVVDNNEIGGLVFTGLSVTLFAALLVRHRVGASWLAGVGMIVGVGTILMVFTGWEDGPVWLVNLNLVIALVCGLVAAPLWTAGQALEMNRALSELG